MNVRTILIEGYYVAELFEWVVIISHFTDRFLVRMKLRLGLRKTFPVLLDCLLRLVISVVLVCLN